MKRLLAVCLLLSGCASPEMQRFLFGYTDEERITALVARYGPRCGVTLDDYVSNRQVSEAEGQRVADCIKAHALADQRRPGFLENLGAGFRDAGAIMGGGAAGPSIPAPRGADIMCMNDCTRRYSFNYCQKLCSF